jgi:hypothetical protein
MTLRLTARAFRIVGHSLTLRRTYLLLFISHSYEQESHHEMTVLSPGV